MDPRNLTWKLKMVSLNSLVSDLIAAGAKALW